MTSSLSFLYSGTVDIERPQRIDIDFGRSFPPRPAAIPPLWHAGLSFFYSTFENRCNRTKFTALNHVGA